MFVPCGSTCEEDDAFQLWVEEEVVERPDTPFLSVRVGRQVWVISRSRTKATSIETHIA
jgi:hypothetical protein